MQWLSKIYINYRKTCTPNALYTLLARGEGLSLFFCIITNTHIIFLYQPYDNRLYAN